MRLVPVLLVPGRLVVMLLLAALVLTAAAWLRGAEYDEQYTLFLTAGVPRPNWPQTVFPAGIVAHMQTGHATLTGIARDLRATDVHPPLYFWAISLWRAVFGSNLFVARLFSVLCGLLSLGLVGLVARRCKIAPFAAMLLTLGCYGFVYTNAIARGFAPAQTLTLCGTWLLLRRQPLLAGACLGAAFACNYLAVFVAVAVIVAGGNVLAATTTLPFLAVDAWFFAAQHAARTGQFPPFQLWPSIVRLAEYQTAALFGGLPLYVDGPGRLVVEAAVGLLTIGLIVKIAQSRPLSSTQPIRILLAAAIAPPIGLLLLGALFDNTPIELRYLSFGLPFIALLTARALHQPSTLHQPSIMMIHRPPAAAILLLTVQLTAIAGLLLSPRTMQPARAAAVAAARLVGARLVGAHPIDNAIVLLPRGNDGVGIVGAFGSEAPPSLPLLLVRPTDSLTDRIARYHRVTLATLAQDRDSVATVTMLHTMFTAPNWRRVAIGSNLEVYERTDAGH
jgi:hypothetical protein